MHKYNPPNKYDFFPVCLLLTNHKTLYNFNIVLGIVENRKHASKY